MRVLLDENLPVGLEMQLAENQPSANFSAALLSLCKAVESEIPYRLGSISGLGFLAGRIELGAADKNLRNAKLEGSTKQSLISNGIKPGFVTSTLPQLLFGLAKLRRDTGSAHVGDETRSAKEEDAGKARQLTGEVLKGIVPNSDIK